MALPVANTDLTKTWQFLISRVNDLANNSTRWALTTDGNTSYTVPVGNSAITGTFSANNLFLGNSTGNAVLTGFTSTLTINTVTSNTVSCNIFTVLTSMQVGDSGTNAVINSSALALSNSTSNLTVSIPTPDQIANGQYYLSSNGQWVFNQTAQTYQTNTSGLTTQLIDFWPKNPYRVGDYVMKAKDQTNAASNNRVGTRLLLMHDGTNAYITEYATIVTNTSVGTFSVSTNTTSVLLNFTPAFANCAAIFVRTLV